TLNSEINNFKIETEEQTSEEGDKIILEDAEGLEVQSIELVPERETIQVVEKRFESIGPVIGEELKNKAIWAIGLALIIIIAFIAFAFRQVSKPVASWKYGIGAIIALAHDIIIVVGAFSVLNHFFLGFEVDILFVTALLTILGYSVNDTIVVYDRTRENLIYNPQSTFEETINKSVNDTITRSVNTSLTTLLVLLSLYFLGGTTIQNFVLALICGTLIGAYSSIFIASPLLVVWQKMSRKK
ncbi:MAG: protein translocase subunit SecF, partial [Patescibacteria group bacterium]